MVLVRLMLNVNNKYYLIPDGVIHVKGYHPQFNKANGLLELDDWAGTGAFKFHSAWMLTNGNMMIETTDVHLRSLIQTDVYSFKNELLKEMNNAIDEVKKFNSPYKTNFRHTKLRLDTIRKYYGK